MNSQRQIYHRGVSPIVATLFLVAIAVVSSTLVFTFSNGFMSSAQMSGTPTIENVKIIGFDARDVDILTAHDGNEMDPGAQISLNNQKESGENIAVYLKNDGVQPITVAELLLGGEVYSYEKVAVSGLQFSNYTITNDCNAVTCAITENVWPIVLPGEFVTVYVKLNKDFPMGRDTQFKLTTAEGQVFVDTIIMGDRSG